MSRGSYTQSNFLGGRFSPSASGRIDLPLYRTALAECLNAYPQEEGNITRRPGTRLIGPTLNGYKASILQPFPISQSQSYVFEFTADNSSDVWMRAYTSGHIVTEGSRSLINAISTGTPAEITLNASASWSTNDQIRLQVQYASLPASQDAMWSPLVNREFTVTKIDSTHFTLADAITNTAINGSGFTGAIPTIYADRVIRTNVSPWNGKVTNPNQIRAVQTGSSIFLLNANQGVSLQPASLTIATAPSATADATFTIVAAAFDDGPYLAPDSVDGPYTVSGVSGSITFTTTGITQINGGNGFQSTDVDRLIRIYQVPPLWVVSTTYTAGEVISWPSGVNAVPYVALANSGTNLGHEPDTSNTFWAPIANYATWNWGTITAVGSTTSVTVLLAGTLQATTDPLPQIALGEYTNTGANWPTAGAFFEERVVFSMGQNIDFSTSGGADGPTITFSPTDPYGNVLDSSGISEVLIGRQIPLIFWMHPDNAALILGCAGSEWVVQASQLGNPLTPTSFQAHPVTEYGSNYELPERPGIALCFINRYNQRLLEYLIDPFTQKYSGKPINLYADDITQGLFCLAYQDEPNPILWTIGNGWAGCTYRRVSYFASEMPTFYGWHKHVLGSGKSIAWIENGFDVTGENDLLYMTTEDGTNGWVEFLTPPIGDNGTLTQANFVDSGFTGIIYSGPPYRYEGMYGVSDGNGNIVFNGLYYLAGKSVAVWLAGLDFGNYTVSAAGTITVPYASDPGKLGTLSFIQGTAVASNTEGAIPISFTETLGGGNFWIPGVIGFTYSTTIEKLRPDDPESSGMRSGGAGQLKRHHWYALNVVQGVANTIQVGGDSAGTLYPATLANYKTGQPTPTSTMFQGIHRDTIESDDNLDGQMYLTISRPAPMTLCQITGFLETEEI